MKSLQYLSIMPPIPQVGLKPLNLLTRALVIQWDNENTIENLELFSIEAPRKLQNLHCRDNSQIHNFKIGFNFLFH